MAQVGVGAVEHACVVSVLTGVEGGLVNVPKLGSEGTVVPYKALAPLDQMSDSERPCVPVILMG